MNGNEIKKEMAEEMAKEFGFPNDPDIIVEYLEENFGEAIDAYPNHCIYDVDKMVLLKEILGFNVSYELFVYLDRIYEMEDVDLLELGEQDYDELMEHCKQYAHRISNDYENLNMD